MSAKRTERADYEFLLGAIACEFEAVAVDPDPAPRLLLGLNWLLEFAEKFEPGKPVAAAERLSTAILDAAPVAATLSSLGEDVRRFLECAALLAGLFGRSARAARRAQAEGFAEDWYDQVAIFRDVNDAVWRQRRCALRCEARARDLRIESAMQAVPQSISLQ